MQLLSFFLKPLLNHWLFDVAANYEIIDIVLIQGYNGAKTVVSAVEHESCFMMMFNNLITIEYA